MRNWLSQESGAFGALFSMEREKMRDLAQASYGEWTFESLAHPVSLSSRGFDGREKLERYPFRDDGGLIWSSISTFVEEYLGVYYLSEWDCEADGELQAFYREAFEIGHANAHYANLSDTCSRAEIGAILKSIIWTCSVSAGGVGGGGEARPARTDTMDKTSPYFPLDHFALANTSHCLFVLFALQGQHSCLSNVYQTYGFPPWRPTLLHTPPPRTKGACSALTFVLMLPTRAETALQAAFFYNMNIDRAKLGPLVGPSSYITERCGGRGRFRTRGEGSNELDGWRAGKV